jgi:hypothetical protein
MREEGHSQPMRREFVCHLCWIAETLSASAAGTVFPEEKDLGCCETKGNLGWIVDLVGYMGI